MASASTPSSAVGKEVISYCMSCKMDLAHVVVAMKGDRIVKCQCKTCKKEHGFKTPKGITEPPAAKPVKEKKSRKAVAAENAENAIELEWEKLMLAHKHAPLKSYTMKGHFLLGDKLNHPNFGEGIVGKLIYPNKVEVIFRTDVKVLIHGGAAAL